MPKKIYTRDEFEFHLKGQAKIQSENKELHNKALEVLIEADKYDWVHQTRWFGEPALQSPEDMITLQDILFRTRPQFFIEIGTAWSGSLLMYASIMNALSFGHVIGIDTYIPDDLIERVNSFPKLKNHISFIKGSSTETSTIKKVKEIIGDSTKVAVHLDSNHSHEHVLKELNIYAPLVGIDQYLICGDTVVEEIPQQSHRPRPWGPGNSPKTALDEYLKKVKGKYEFLLDKEIFSKILISNQKEGYLIRKS